MTIVAAWIKALTGVGPSIASGSQMCSGNWADFPTAPMKSSRAMSNIRSGDLFGDRGEHVAVIQASEVPEDQDYADGESEVADSIDEESLYRRISCGLALVPEADEQI